MQDFDKLDGILRDYKHFMSENPDIDRTLPTHVHMSGFADDGLQVHVHVSLPPHLPSLRQQSLANTAMSQTDSLHIHGISQGQSGYGFEPIL